MGKDISILMIYVRFTRCAKSLPLKLMIWREHACYRVIGGYVAICFKFSSHATATLRQQDTYISRRLPWIASLCIIRPATQR